MANNNRAINRANKNIRDIAQGITSNMDALYRSTYMSTPQQGRDLNDLNDKINASIDKIVDSNMESIGMPSVTKLYSRLMDSKTGSGSSELFNGLDSISDSSLMTEDIYGMFMSNMYLKELDDEIDTICKYMPKLEEALETQKDNVLAADHFSKDFINMKCEGISSNQDMLLFNDRANSLKKKYNIATLVEDIYSDTSKYGERFIYVVPYRTAIAKLLATKGDTLPVSQFSSIGESSNIDMSNVFRMSMSKNSFSIDNGFNENVLTESVSAGSTVSGSTISTNKSNGLIKDNESFKLMVELCKNNILESAVYDYKKAKDKNDVTKKNSMHALYENSLHEEKDIAAKGNIDFGDNKLDDRLVTSKDGLIDTKKVEKLDINGCVVQKLKREQILPIYINDVNMGYYYIEVRSIDGANACDIGFKNILGSSNNPKNIETNSIFNNIDTARQDGILRYISGQLSRFIDKQFVNNNQDLSNEIYMILKHNDLFNTPSADLIKVTFIPPEDIIHFYFKMDEDSHRGISDLAKSLIPGKIYTSLYLTNALAQLTRGQDKRVYYVKQTVDTNIAQVLLNTISQIKQSNFGVRSFQNINSILNITGKFDDYVIPTNASGEAPIQFEVMPGQDVKTPTELMDQLEEAAINATGVPLEIIQARQSIDYAMQLTMSSSKFLRWCYKRQELFENLLSRMITCIYNYEYNENVEIKVTLPPPSFLNITNTNQLIDNTKTFVQSIVEVELANEEDDKLKNAYTYELFKHYIGTHIDINTHKSILDRCKMELKKEQDETHATGGDQDSEY